MEGSLATETPSRVATVALEAAREEGGKEVARKSVERLLRSGLLAVSRKYSDAAHLCVASLWLVCCNEVIDDGFGGDYWCHLW